MKPAKNCTISKQQKLEILLGWLEDNVDMGTTIEFAEGVDSSAMIPAVKTAVDLLNMQKADSGILTCAALAATDVLAERSRQVTAEGWTPEHDDQYGKSQLLWASSCYVLNTIQPFNRIPMDWPWAPEWWKPTNPRRDLVKAGALILAEIERIDRAALLRKGDAL